MYSILIVVHIITCVLLVLTVLLQQGKGAEIGAVFGSSDTLFGSAGPASFLHKLTTGLAVVFMVTSLVLTYLSAHKVGDSIMQDVEVTTSPVTTEPVVIPKTVETVPAPVREVGEPARGLGDQPENIAPSTTQPETSK